MKYIDAEKLIAEIERMEKEYNKAIANPSFSNYEASLIAKGKHRQREDILRLISSLQQEQPEVDLEKEFQEYWYLHQYDQRLRRLIVDGHGRAVLRNIAGHFYELGLNARKEESIGVAESPSKTFPRVNEFDCGSSYRH